MSMTVSVRIEHRAGDRAAGQARHDTRAGKVPGYVDREKSDRNSVLIQPRTPGDLRSLCEERRAGRETKRRMKTDAAVASVGIITFGTDAQRTIDAMSPDQQDRYEKAAALAAIESVPEASDDEAAAAKPKPG